MSRSEAEPAFIFDCQGVIRRDGLADTYRQFGGDPEADTDIIRAIVNNAHKGTISSAAQAMVDHLNTLHGSTITVEDWRAASDKYSPYDHTLLAHIRLLRDAGYTTSMLTNASADYSLQPVEHLFSPLIKTSQYGCRKPEVRAFVLAATILDRPLDQCVLVDNNARNCEAARGVGMHVLRYTGFEAYARSITQYLRPPLQNEAQLT